MTELLKCLWTKRRLIIGCTILFAFAGLLAAILTPKQFRAHTRFVPQTEEQIVNSEISGLDAIAGVQFNSKASAQIPATLYPAVGESVAFRMDLLNTSIRLKSGMKMLFKEYLLHYQKSSLIKEILKHLFGFFYKPRINPGEIEQTSENKYFVLTKEECELITTLDEVLSIHCNEEEGIVYLSISLSHPEIAAQMAAEAMEKLQQTLIAFKIKNAEKVLSYINGQYIIKKQEFVRIQKKLAEFKDSHKNIGTAVFRNELSKLETQYDISYSLYKELAIQKEQAKLQVNKDTPIFSVIQPVTQPNKKTTPRRGLMLMVSTFLGLTLSSGFVLILPKIRNIIKELPTNQSHN